MKLPVHRIIPFSNVEGLGNRTSIFVQGCNANCLYCHNSETIPMKSSEAKLYTVDELVKIIEGNKPFIRGITISGGEATLYHEFLTELFKRVHDIGLTCYVDSNGFYNHNKIEGLIEQTDKFLFDIKGLGESLEPLCFSNFNHQGVLAKESKRFIFMDEHFENLNQLLEQNKVEEVRLVYIKGYYNAQQLLTKLASLLQNYPQVLVKLIRVHVRGLPRERIIKLKSAIPSKTELDHLATFACELGLINIVTIY